MVCQTVCASHQEAELKLVVDVKADSAFINISVYVVTVISCIMMVTYAIYITYKQGKMTKLVEKGRETLSNLNLNPSSYSLVAIGQTIKRRTMEKLQESCEEKDIDDKKNQV